MECLVSRCPYTCEAVRTPDQLVAVSKEIFQKADDKVAEKMKNLGVSVFSGVVDAKDGAVVMSIPPGFFVCERTLNMGPSAGVRFSFLAKGPSVKENMQFVAPPIDGLPETAIV